jgi:hypothetical protein
MTPSGWFVLWRTVIIAALLLFSALAIQLVTVVV